MIYRKLCKLLESQFSIIEGNITEEAFLSEDLGLDLVELAMALEDVFEIEEVTDLSSMETVADLIDFLQRELDL